jgi:uncharacterized protein YbjT (DUF2867 family)
VTVLVAGATGSLGVEICRRLCGTGTAVRALVRPTARPDRLEALRARGAELVEGDLKQPASLELACRRVNAVVSTASATLFEHYQEGDSIQTVDLEGNRALVDAARRAGARRFLFVSSTSTDDSPATRAKRDVENHLEASGIPFTVLRATRYMEVWLTPLLGFDPAAGRARIFGAGDQPVSWISRDDVAEFIRLVLDDPSGENATIDLGGPEALSPLEVVRVFEEVTGKPFELEFVSTDELRAEQAAATDPLLASYVAFCLACADGDAVPMGETLRRFPVRLTSVREYAERGLSSASA